MSRILHQSDDNKLDQLEHCSRQTINSKKKEVFLGVGKTQGEKVKGQRPMVCRRPIILFCNKVHL